MSESRPSDLSSEDLSRDELDNSVPVKLQRGSRARIRTPDQRVRVFISSTIKELAAERVAAREAVARLRLTPVLFELGARPHAARDLYRAYLDQSHIFVGIYWQSYGYVVAGEAVSGLEDEYLRSIGRPRLIYFKEPSPDRDERLRELVGRIKNDDAVSYQRFATADELRELLENDLALLLSERFETFVPSASPPDTGRLPGKASRRGLPLPSSQLGKLVGRKAELEKLVELLRSTDVPLITLTGAGGIGKSRLAIQLAMEAAPLFPGGVSFVSFLNITSLDEVLPAIGEAIGLPAETGSDWPAVLAESLGGRRHLLVLDGTEKVEGAGALLSDLLDGCPRLKILVTSRFPLRVRAERRFPLMSLEQPERSRTSDDAPRNVQALGKVASVELFMHFARKVRQDFELRPENAAIVAELCRKLDGLPLALELAATRLNVLSLQALATQVDRPLELFTSGMQDQPERLRSIRASVAWSYDLLAADPKRLFPVLSVFNDTFSLEAVAAVTRNPESEDKSNLATLQTLTPRPPPSLLEALNSLVDCGLLVRADRATSGPIVEPFSTDRFRMLGINKEFARELFERGADADFLRLQHARFYLALVEEFERRVIGPEVGAWLSSLDMEFENLLAALAWCQSPMAGSTSFGKEKTELGLRLAGALGWFWFMRGRVAEGRRVIETFLSDPASHAFPAARAKASFAAAGLSWATGDFSAARVEAGESISKLRMTGGKRELALALAVLAIADLSEGDEVAAQVALGESHVLFRQAGGRWGEAFTLAGLGTIAVAAGDANKARTMLAQSLALFLKLDDRWARVIVLLLLRSLAHTSGDERAAIAFLRECATLLRPVADTTGVRRILGAIESLGSPSRKTRPLFTLARAEDLWTDLGSTTALIMSLTSLALLAPRTAGREAIDSPFWAAQALVRTVAALWDVGRSSPGPITSAERPRYAVTTPAKTPMDPSAEN